MAYTLSTANPDRWKRHLSTKNYGYDALGRTSTKKVTENGELTLHYTNLYRGYLQIATESPRRDYGNCLADCGHL